MGHNWISITMKYNSANPKTRRHVWNTLPHFFTAAREHVCNSGVTTAGLQSVLISCQASCCRSKQDETQLEHYTYRSQQEEVKSPRRVLPCAYAMWVKKSNLCLVFNSVFGSHLWFVLLEEETRLGKLWKDAPTPTELCLIKVACCEIMLQSSTGTDRWDTGTEIKVSEEIIMPTFLYFSFLLRSWYFISALVGSHRSESLCLITCKPDSCSAGRQREKSSRLFFLFMFWLRYMVWC